MVGEEKSTQTQTQTDGPEEVKPIRLLGGPHNNRTIADQGQARVEFPDGDLYKRIELKVNVDGVMPAPFDVLVYWGKGWHQGIETSGDADKV